MLHFRRQARFLSPRKRTCLTHTIFMLFLVFPSHSFCSFPFNIYRKQAISLAATSSKHLKEEQQRRPPKRKKIKRENAKTRLARAAANAAALYPEDISATSSQVSPALGSLLKLTHAIDEQLRQQQATNFSPKPSLQPQDSMSSLLDFNEEHACHNTCYTVALVFGKALQDDQVTAEYAARIRSLVILLIEEPNTVDVVCFCGSISGENYIADADAGYTFFRHLCASHSVDLSTVNIFIDRTAKDEASAISNTVKHLQAYYVSDWLKESSLEESAVDEYGQPRTRSRKRIQIHLSLISTGYHLCNLNDIHHRSPGQSLLRPVELMRRVYSSFAQYEVWDDDDDDDATEASTGIVETSWSYRYATYPYFYANEDAVAFMARCYLLGEELMPLVVNLKGVVQEVHHGVNNIFVCERRVTCSLVSSLLLYVHNVILTPLTHITERILSTR